MSEVTVSANASALSQVTPLVLTWNEAPNIRRCLERLGWAARVVVLDSGSTDETANIARTFRNVEVVTRPFDTHTAQWNHGIGLVTTPWVLSLDADYVVPDAVLAELTPFIGQAEFDAVFAPFRYCVFGRPLRASLYPPRAVLFRKDRCRYEPDGHTQLLTIPGRSASISTPIDHDDRKPLGRWLVSQDKYAGLEVEKLLTTPREKLSAQDRLRRTIVLAPGLVLLYTLFVKRAVFDGWPGWYYALQRCLAEMILSLRLLEKKVNPSRPD